MSRNSNARILLVWLIAVVAGIAWWLLRVESAAETNAGNAFPLAEAIPLDRVDAIEIRYADGRFYRFESTPAGWRQLEPFPVGLDAYSVRQIGSIAQGLQRVDSIDVDSGDDRARLGLDPPAATVTWRWPDGSQSVALGNRTLAGRAWASIDEGSGRADLVGAALHERILENDPRFLRDRALAADAGPRTGRIEIEAGNERMVIEQTDTGWRLLEPVETRADDAAIADWLARTARARVAGYLYDEPDRLDRFGLVDPIASVRLVTRGGEQQQLILLGDPIGVGSSDRYALVEGSPTILRLDEQTQRVLVPTAATLVDSTGTGVVREDVAQIEIRSPAGTLTLVREFDAWRAGVQDSPLRDVEREPVEQLLGQLTSSRAGEIAITGYPAELEHSIVILYGFDGGPLDTVRIVREEGNGRWALENGDGVLRVFPSSFEPPLTPADFGIQTE